MVIVQAADGTLVRYRPEEARRLGLVDYRSVQRDAQVRPSRTKKVRPTAVKEPADDDLRNDD
jgi:hypothetical protein